MNGNGHRPRILVIGGGSGSSTILRGLKRHPAQLTAVVTMFDSGGSSGLLRQEFGLPPFGDLRQCLLALADDNQHTQVIRQALAFRFGQSTSLNGHSLGNLLLAALTSLNNDLERTLADIGQILNVAGDVVPVTLEKAELCAELEDGHVIRGETHIDLRLTPYPRIKRIFLDPPVSANPKAIKAVLEADAIVLGPGDLYTSILPNLLVEGLTEAIAVSRAVRIYVSNLMTKRSETDGFKASDFVREVVQYLGSGQNALKVSGHNLDWAIVNNRMPSAFVQEAYENEGAHVVEPDLDEVGRYVKGIIGASLASSELPLRHDPERIAEAVFQAMGGGRMAHYLKPSIAQTLGPDGLGWEGAS